MKYILSLLLCGLLAGTAWTQPEYGLHFMRNVSNANLTNPGFAPRQTFYVGGISEGFDLSLRGLGDATFFSADSNNVYSPNYFDLLNNMDEALQTRLGNKTEFGIGARFGKLFVSVNSNVKINSQLDIPRTAFEMAWYGNENAIGQTVDIGPAFAVNAYLELGLGLTYAVSPQLSVGIRPKRLFGIASASTSRNQLNLTTGADNYDLTVDADYQVNMSSSFASVTPSPDGLIENTTFSFDESIIRNPSVPQGNNGWGLDLGATYQLSQKLELGFSLLDLGYIDWNTGLSGLRAQGTYTFNGLDFNDAVRNDNVSFGAINDTLRSLINLQRTEEGTAFRTTLSPKMYLSALLTLGYWELGGMYYLENTTIGDDYSTIGLSGRYVIEDRFSFGAVYAYRNGGRFDNLGANGTMRLGPLQLHLILDNILPLFHPDRLEYTNVRAGFNLVLGTKKMRRIQLENRLKSGKASRTTDPEEVNINKYSF